MKISLSNASGVIFINGKYEKVYQRILIKRKPRTP